jgi:hypothetical protein
MSCLPFNGQKSRRFCECSEPRSRQITVTRCALLRESTRWCRKQEGAAEAASGLNVRKVSRGSQPKGVARMKLAYHRPESEPGD